MLDYGRSMGGVGYGGNDFAAMPKVIQGKPKYKDPYGGKIQEEYYPQNIMHDKRVARGSTYAAMVIPAGTNPDAMMMDKKNDTRKTKSFKRTQQDLQSPQARVIYPNRDIPTPEPVPGRLHMEIQTEKYVENLTDKPPEREEGVATEFYLDRPPVPLFNPKMPSKDNCKAIQIDENDPELFDFEREIEPMLNVLITKTLEQARMRVLEEEELRIMRTQQKEYEEIRNAELIEAQRLEAAELRRKQELERRRVQQKARKEEKRAAHKKHVARVMAKSYLVGLRENALKALKDQGMLIEPIEQVMTENVMPWVLEQMAEFIEDEDIQEFTVEDVIKGAFELAKAQHRQGIEMEMQKRKDAVSYKQYLIEEKENQRKRRRELREERRKQQELEKLKNEIKSNFVDKGEPRDHILQQDLLEVHGHYEKGKSFIGSVGGHITQVALALQCIRAIEQANQERMRNDGSEHTLQNTQSQKDLSKNAVKKHPMELIEGPGLFTFILNYIKDLKNDTFTLLISEQTAALVEQLKINLNELHKVDENNLKQLKNSMNENPGSFVLKIMRNESDFIEGLFSYDLIIQLQNMIVDILSKKLPSDVSFNNAKLEQVINKIKLVPIPKHIHEQSVTGQEIDQETGQQVTKVVTEKNTNERAIVFLKIPRKQEKVQEEYLDDNGQVQHSYTTKLVEQEQDDRVLTVPARVDNVPYSIFVVNELGPRIHRREIFNYIKKSFAEYFDGRDIQKELDEMSNLGDAMFERLMGRFIMWEGISRDRPVFDFDINLND